MIEVVVSSIEGSRGMMNNNTEITVIISNIAERLVSCTRVSISRLEMHPDADICGVAEGLNHCKFGSTFHPGSPDTLGRADCIANITKGRIIPDEIGDCTSTCFTVCRITLRPCGLKTNRSQLIGVGRVDDLSSKWF